MPPPLRSSRTSASGGASPSKTITVGLTLSEGLYPILFYANRIGLENIGAEPVVHFGTISDSAGTLSQFAAVFDRSMIRNNHKEWSAFLARNPPAATATADFSFRCSPNALRSVPVIAVAMWAALNDQAELRLYSLSMGETLTAQQEGGGSVTAQAVALIRMPRDLQTHFLATLLNKYHAKD